MILLFKLAYIYLSRFQIVSKLFFKTEKGLSKNKKYRIVIFINLAFYFYTMALFNIDKTHSSEVTVGTSIMYAVVCTIFIIMPQFRYMIAVPAGILTIASLFLCPFTISLALLFSTTGDLMGSFGNLIGQTAFFAAGHICLITYFIKRYLTKVEHDRKLTGKAKGYLAMVVFCTTALLALVLCRIIPEIPDGTHRWAAGIYTSLICTMMFTALLQRSSLFALGSVMFVFSDFILAWNMYVEPIPGSFWLTIVPYFAAQWLIFVRTTSFRIAPEMRILRF